MVRNTVEFRGTRLEQGTYRSGMLGKFVFFACLLFMTAHPLRKVLAACVSLLVFLTGTMICGDTFFSLWAYPLGFALLALWAWNIVLPMTADCGASEASVLLQRLLFCAAFLVTAVGLAGFLARSDSSFGVTLYILSVVLGLSAAMHAWIDRRYARPFLQLVERSRGPRSWAAEAREIAESILNHGLRIKVLELASRCEVAVSDVGYPTPIENEQISLNLTRMHAAAESRNWSVLGETVDDTSRLLSMRESSLRRADNDEEDGSDAVDRWNALGQSRAVH